MTTVLGEGFLQGVKKAYEVSNKKNTLDQVHITPSEATSTDCRKILRTDTFMTAISRIRWQVDDSKRQQAESDKDTSVRDSSSAADIEFEAESEMLPFHVKLGALQPRTTVHQVESRGGPFQGFGLRLWQYLMDDGGSGDGSRDNLGVNQNDSTIMACMTVRVNQSQSLYHTQLLQINEYRVIYHEYVSKDDHTLKQDIIRCSDSFFHHARHDTVLIDTNLGQRTAVLQIVFECKHQGHTWQLAQITYFAPVGTSPDAHIGQLRVREMATPQITELASIERACHLIPAFDDTRQDHYINDLVDTDMYIRLGEL